MAVTLMLPLFIIGEGFAEVVDAEIVNVAPHLPATFAVHKYSHSFGLWQVSHVETGASIGQYPDRLQQSKSAAIRYAREYLKEKTAEQHDKAVRKALRKYPEIRKS